MAKSKILIAESDDALRAEISAALATDGFIVAHAASAEAVAQQGREDRRADLLIVGSTLRARDDGLRAARATIAQRPRLPVILIASDSCEELAIAALRAGCVDYFTRPVPIPDLIASVRRRVGAPRGAPECDTSASHAGGGIEMIGHSRPLREIRAYLLKVAATDSSALITGETGTGKELAAAMIHRHSARRTRPFVCINCAAIPDSLLESELFGYERGAFTGAQVAKEGTLKLADGGTVFFDEVGDLSPYAQAKLLRAIEMREARPLGARREVAFDIRVIAATNRDLQELMAEQKFRADLFFRLNVAGIHLPPLRVRKEDLIPLSRYYIGQMNGRSQRNVEGFSPETLDALMRYDWPGNVRELRNLIEAVFIEPPSRWIAPADLPAMFRKRFAAAAESPGSERDRVLSALLATNWNKSRAAQKLRWSRMTLYRKMSRYQVVNQASLMRNPERTGQP
jgi:DNA-binding NtrC family response regulator